MKGAFRPSKERGQNFLVDKGVARRFVSLLDPAPGDVVLEIGPGKGALTDPLLAVGCAVVAVEVEAALAEALAARGDPGLEVVRGDFLRLPDEALLTRLHAARASRPGGRILALSNVPYSVTGPVLGRLLSGALAIERLVVGVQREVADRIVAPPGSRTYGRLSVLAAAWGEFKTGFKIGPGAYRPRPKVQSAALLGTRDPGREPIAPRSPMARVVRAAFGQRRKMLRNTLAAGLGLSKPQAVALCEGAAVDPTGRAEGLDLAAFRRLCLGFEAAGAGGSAGGPPPESARVGATESEGNGHGRCQEEDREEEDQEGLRQGQIPGDPAP